MTWFTSGALRAHFCSSGVAMRSYERPSGSNESSPRALRLINPQALSTHNKLLPREPLLNANDLLLQKFWSVRYASRQVPGRSLAEFSTVIAINISDCNCCELG